MARIYFGQKALFVEAGVKTGMSVLVDNPLEVGADRIVNGRGGVSQVLAGRALWWISGRPITFDVISRTLRISWRRHCAGMGISSGGVVWRGTAKIAGVWEIKDPGQGDRHEHGDAHSRPDFIMGAVDMVGRDV